MLTLDGYNNSATFSSTESVSDSPLPQNIDTKLLECLNLTIGSAVPLIDPETWLSRNSEWVGAIIGFGIVFFPIVGGGTRDYDRTQVVGRDAMGHKPCGTYLCLFIFQEAEQGDIL